MKPFQLLLLTLALGQGLFVTQVGAQDAVFRYRTAGGSSRVTGKITKVTPEGVTIDGRDVSAAEIRRLSFSKEPSEVNRARENMNGGRYDDALEDLDKITAKISSRNLQAEIDFIRAYSSARISLQGGSITPQSAGTKVREFIAKYPQSIHLYPAIEQYGKLIFAFGKPQAAIQEFEKLTGCQWLEYRLKGYFLQGMLLLETGQMDQAKTAFEVILGEASNEDITQTYKLLAKCGLAKMAGLKGTSKGPGSNWKQ